MKVNVLIEFKKASDILANTPRFLPLWYAHPAIALCRFRMSSIRRLRIVVN